MEEKTTTIAPIGKIVEFEGAADQVEKEIIQQLVAGNLTN